MGKLEKCIFCDIVSGVIPSNILFENESCLAFSDIHPKAPIHLLIIPKKHISSINYLKNDDSHIICDMVFAAQKLAQDHDISKTGYRLVVNTNKDSGQEVDHLHLHLLGGRKMGSMS